MKVYCGTLVHCLTSQAIQVLHNHVIGFEENEYGKIVFVESASQLDALCQEYGFEKADVHCLTESQFLMPGLVDTHIHAPQYVNSGTGYDKMLLDWLTTYTFPAEARFKDKEMATDVYPKVVNQTLKHGTTTAAYFATIHLEASLELCRTIAKAGQRALVGKVNMDQESPDYYVEDTQKSLDETRMFIEGVRKMKNHLIQPIITPRFAPTCSEPLLKGLGELALTRDVHIQSHICEQQPEVEYTLNLFPEHEHCASIFDSNGLLTNKTVMAHCIYLTDAEIKLFKDRGVGIAHCPSSNFSICSGILNTRRMLDLGMKIGLGTDVSGGYSPSIFDAMRKSIEASKALSFTNLKPESGGYKPISHHEALYMATIGGAQALSLDDKIGNFVVGKEFDALLVDVKAPNPHPVFDVFEQDSFDDILMKFLYLGDDRNLLKRFVAGREITLA